MSRPDLYLVRAHVDRRLEIAGELHQRKPPPPAWRQRLSAVAAGVGVAGGTVALVWFMTQLIRWTTALRP